MPAGAQEDAGPDASFPATPFTIKDYLQKEGLVLTDYAPIFIATLGSAIMGLSIPIMTLQVYDRILPNPAGGTLGILLTGVLLALAIDAILKLSRNHLIQKAGAVFEHKMNCRVFGHTLHSNFAQIPGYDPAIQVQKLGAVKDIKDDFTGQSFAAWCENLFLPVYFILLFYIGGKLGFVPLMIVTLYTAISLSVGQKLKAAVKIRDEYDEKRYSFLVNVFNGIHTIKAFAHEKFFQRKYERHKEDVGATNFTVAQYSNILSNLGAISTGTMTLFVITAGAFLVIRQDITTGTLIASILITGRIMQPVQKIVSSMIKHEDSLFSRKEIEDIFKTPLLSKPFFHEDSVPEEGAEKNAPFPPIEGRLELKHMSFAYAGTKRPIFEGVDLSVVPGEAVCLHAGFGSGKTSLMRLMSGIYAPTEGEVLIDGRPATSYAPAELTQRVGLLETEPSIFRGSIRDNITRFGLTPEEQARDICAHLDLNRVIAKLPAGYETLLTGTHTDTLQPGLCQRIAIARVLAMKPKIILFDQADKNLDQESYGTLFKFLGKIKGRATLILITNDENLSSLADTHYDIKDKTLLFS